MTTILLCIYLAVALQPSYRCGEIVSLSDNADFRGVVVNYELDSQGWLYSVVPVP